MLYRYIPIYVLEITKLNLIQDDLINCGNKKKQRFNFF